MGMSRVQGVFPARTLLNHRMRNGDRRTNNSLKYISVFLYAGVPLDFLGLGFRQLGPLLVSFVNLS